MRTQKFPNKIFIIGLMFVSIFSQGYAQDWLSSITYQMSLPSGDTKNYIDETSFSGVGLDFRKMVSDKTTIGFLIGWNVFHKRSTETIELQTKNPGAITGVQDRYINSFPIMLSVHRYFGRGRSTTPYIGLNAGGFVMAQQLAIGIHTFQQDEWQWGIAPEIGIIFPLERNSALIVSGKYQYALSGESPVGGDINHEYWTIGIGFAWSQY
jgi:hypothetical protein